MSNRRDLRIGEDRYVLLRLVNGACKFVELPV